MSAANQHLRQSDAHSMHVVCRKGFEGPCRELIRQLFTYAILGGLMAVLDLLLLFILVDIAGVFYLVAAAMSFVVVVTLGFLLHKTFTFKEWEGHSQLRYLMFLFGAVTGLGWSLTLLFVFVELLGLQYLGAAFIMKFVVFFWNFSVNKFITFGRNTPTPKRR